MNIYSGEEFLSRLYKDLHLTREIERSSLKSDKKVVKIRKYLIRLERIQKQTKNSPLGKQLLKKMYYNRYVIKSENIPESYFERQRQLAFDRGFGHIEIEDHQKKKQIDLIIQEQMHSLDIWIDYFLSPDTKMYPSWAKYWAFQGMTHIGMYDKKSNKFTRRTENTVASFIELNREALSSSISQMVGILDHKPVDDATLEAIIKSGSFRKIYEYNYKKILFNKKSNTMNKGGQWKKYRQGTEDYKKLVKSLQGKGTGWCTAGLETAKEQLANGDFYVYYSYNSKNKPTNPRLAIRMEGDSIGEIRGIAEDHNIETDMEGILNEKLKEFPDGENYKKIIDQMHQLTIIYDKSKNGKFLSKEELMFIYEIKEPIIDEDPRIDEIIEDRDEVADYNIIFEGLKKLEGSVNLFTDNIDQIKFPEEVTGDVNIYGATNLDNVVLPKKVGGNCSMTEVKNIDNVILPEEIGGDLTIRVRHIGNIEFKPKIKGALRLKWLEDVQGTLSLEEVGGAIELDRITSEANLVLSEHVHGELNLSSLTHLEQLKLPRTVDGTIFLESIEELRNIVFPEIMKGAISLDHVRTLENVKFSESIEKSVFSPKLEMVTNVIFPKKVAMPLTLSKVKVLKNVVFPEEYPNSMILEKVEEMDNVVFPKYIDGDFCLSYLPDNEKEHPIILPETVEASMYIGGTSLRNRRISTNVMEDIELEEIEGMENVIFDGNIEGTFRASDLTHAANVTFHQKIGRSFELPSLYEMKDCSLPEMVKGSMNLGIIKAEGNLLCPRYIGGNIKLNNLRTAQNVIFSEYIGGSLSLASLETTEGFNPPKTVVGKTKTETLDRILQCEAKGSYVKVKK